MSIDGIQTLYDHGGFLNIEFPPAIQFLALRLREKELAAVKLNDPADVELVAAELELDKKVAERRLREHGGDVLQTLRTFVQE